MEISVRTATQEDAPAIAVLSCQLGYAQDETTAAELLAALLKSNDDAVFVAVGDGKVLGWLHVFRALRMESGVFAEIGGLVIDEAARGTGIGSRLVEKAKEWTREKSIGKLKVRSNTLRVDAHHFYRNKGFSPVKQQQVYEWEHPGDQDFGTTK